MRRRALLLILTPALIAGCAARNETTTRATLGELRHVEPDLEEAEIEQGLDQAMEGYRRFLEETPETEMTPEAMRRLADLEIEKKFGIRGGDDRPPEMAAPEPAPAPEDPPAEAAGAARAESGRAPRESDEEFEHRTTVGIGALTGGFAFAFPAAGPNTDAAPEGPVEAIELYDRLLAEYPNYEHKDQVLYQMARAYDELGRTEEALEAMERLIRTNPHSEHMDEVQFRRGEYFFTRRHYRDAEDAYSAIISLGPRSSYYELALYKLGWTFYKQDLYEEALHRYVTLLDHKVAMGYDFDQTHEEEDERRVTDTYRVISLSFSNLGGPDAVREYFSAFGKRSYEDRVYSNLGQHYLAKLRYDDAAKTYRAFVELYPFHRAAPSFGMRLVETFTTGGFPRLVLESKREFASKYGLQAGYWRRHDPGERPDVMAYLKANLEDLATHFHAQYQEAGEEGEKLEHYREARRWYGDYLESFPDGGETPQVNYRLADLLLEHEDFGGAAREYERTAYQYAPHSQSAAAGYAAVYAYREQLESANPEMRDVVMRHAIDSSIRFADAFPENEHAAVILGAAADDLYEMRSYGEAVASAQRVIDMYPGAEESVRRSAWIVVAHGSFDLSEYPRAEHAYGQVLEVTPEDDEARIELVDNLAASIYRQGELARGAEDHRAAADHFLRIRSSAPASKIRPAAEYDAGASLMALQSWLEAAEVFEAFRDAYPGHELQREATRQIARAYKESGELWRAAEEYERLAAQAEDPDLRGEALLAAGELYEQSKVWDRALAVYGRYVEEFPQPVEAALETRLKMASIHKSGLDVTRYHEELAEIVRIEEAAGPERTARTRTIAGRSALVLAEELFREFAAVRLLQPFETSLKNKKDLMDASIEAMGRLVEYEIAEVTAAATYYMAETYFDFSRSLLESERPLDLGPAELAEYEVVLEEEAFPFEEQAIDVHEKNVEMLQAGVFNAWIEKSLGKLSRMVPGRYAKNEISAGFLGAMDSYVYRTPVSQFIGPMVDASGKAGRGEPARGAGPKERLVEGQVMEHATRED